MGSFTIVSAWHGLQTKSDDFVLCAWEFTSTWLSLVNDHTSFPELLLSPIFAFAVIHTTVGPLVVLNRYKKVQWILIYNMHRFIKLIVYGASELLKYWLLQQEFFLRCLLNICKILNLSEVEFHWIAWLRLALEEVCLIHHCVLPSFLLHGLGKTCFIWDALVFKPWMLFWTQRTDNLYLGYACGNMLMHTYQWSCTSLHTLVLKTNM